MGDLLRAEPGSDWQTPLPPPVTRKERRSAKCKSGTTVLLVHHPAPWSPWSPWSTLIQLGPQFPECGYTKWSKQDQGGPGVVQGHRQDHGAGWWTRSIQDHRGPLKNIFLMDVELVLHFQQGSEEIRTVQ